MGGRSGRGAGARVNSIFPRKGSFLRARVEKVSRLDFRVHVVSVFANCRFGRSWAGSSTLLSVPTFSFPHAAYCFGWPCLVRGTGSRFWCGLVDHLERKTFSESLGNCCQSCLSSVPPLHSLSSLSSTPGKYLCPNCFPICSTPQYCWRSGLRDWSPFGGDTINSVPVM